MAEISAKWKGVIDGETESVKRFIVECVGHCGVAKMRPDER